MSKVFIAGLAASALSLSACGGGGGSMGPSAPVQKPPMVTAANTDIANLKTGTLAAKAKSGTKSTIANGVTRFTSDFTLDGQTGSVSVDTIDGAGDQLVQYTLGNKATVFTMAGKAVASTKLPSGGYNGPLDMTYRTKGNGQWQAAFGEMNLVLDTQKGTVAIGGIAGSGTNVVEFFGDTTVKDGKFADTDTIVRLRDGQGKAIADYTGRVDGRLVDGAKKDAITGLVGADDRGFEMNGGFTATR